MIRLLTDSDDWSQSRSVVAHFYYLVVSSGGRRRFAQVDIGSKLSEATNPTQVGDVGRLRELTRSRLLVYTHASKTLAPVEF